MKKSNIYKPPVANNNGFTLIEIIAVLVILSIIGAFAVSRVAALDASAVEKSFVWSERELNSRESLAWSRAKISDVNWIDDERLFAALDLDLGPDYRWGSKTDSGGTLSFRGKTTSLERNPSTYLKPGTWRTKEGF
jgi:prepilin-type N-terminal cleavage/methylation domain-containing protein